MGRAKQLGWFVGIWTASVVGVGLVSLVLRYWLS
jgi:Protein of unknown function (DUF2474)